MTSLVSRLARLAAIVAVTASPLAAQTVAEKPPAELCFVPDAAARCKRFVLLEANLSYRNKAVPGSIMTTTEFGSYPVDNRLHGTLNWALGGMQNVSADNAVGASVSHGFNGSDGSRTTVELRALHWFPNKFAVEGSAGYLQVGHDGPAAHGATAGVALTYRDLVGLTANVQTIHDGRQQSALLLGVRTGSWVAPAATAAGFLGLLALLSTIRLD